ncbi:hypothetical protein [Chitinophaga costaii]|uniref:hypothetical protein n=1 Tax=Chitinophaga costaii TaxID=1335309 RepID=UPI000F515CCA|nr:hypothetical protein [Chitinophaga costaii]
MSKIPLETFKKINPFSLNIIVDDVTAIKEMIEKRDKKQYDWNLLSKFQSQKLAYPNKKSIILKIPINIWRTENILQL